MFFYEPERKEISVAQYFQAGPGGAGRGGEGRYHRRRRF
jgi:hypothetical protein